MIGKIIAVFGIALMLGLLYLISPNKKEVNWRAVGVAVGTQLVLASVLLLTPAWKVVEWIASGFSWLVAQSKEGISFVFGGLTTEYVMFLDALLPIVFLSAFMGLLFHFGVIQWIVKIVGMTVAKLFNISTLSAVNHVTNMFLGQSDSLMVTKSYVPKASDSVIFALVTGGFSSISISVMGLYSSLGASMEWIVASLPLTVLSTIMTTQILFPTKYEGGELELEDDRGVNCLDTMMKYAQDGFKAVVGIVVALMVFISMVYMVNNFIGLIFPSITIEKILGCFFYPLAWLMNVPAGELTAVSQILASKLAFNEAVAFGLPQFAELSETAKAMTTVALCGFAGLGSIGIMAGSMVGVAPNKVKVVARLGFIALLCATIGNLITGAVVGLFL